jgi:rubrerythrin
MGRWTLDDIPWDEFDPGRVDSAIIPVIKAASMVEFNAEDYRTYLTRVFADDPRVTKAVDGWAAEEVQHGQALGRWAELADPSFDFRQSFVRFREGYSLPLDATESVRGSRTGELIARCMVETGTSSYYTALADATDEPVLKEICKRIADDEFAHYALFHNHMKRYLADENLGTWERLKVALSRIAETEDDELAYAYYAANAPESAPYDRKTYGTAYGQQAFAYYDRPHIERAVTMLFSAVGLKDGTWLWRSASSIAWTLLRVKRGLGSKAPLDLAPAKG